MTQKKKGDQMITSLSFGDEDDVKVTNTCVGQPSDQCAADLNVLHDALSGGGAELVEDFTIAPESSGKMTTTIGQKTMAQSQPTQKAAVQPQQKVQAKTG